MCRARPQNMFEEVSDATLTDGFIGRANLDNNFDSRHARVCVGRNDEAKAIVEDLAVNRARVENSSARMGEEPRK